MSQPVYYVGPVPQGRTVIISKESSTIPGTVSRTFSVEADTVLLTLFVTSVTGNLTVKAFTYTEEGKEVEVLAFPVITGPTAELLLRKAAAITSLIRLEITTTGNCNYEVRARGMASGESSVKILGPSSGRTFTTSAGPAASILFSPVLTDRSGLCLRNWSSSGTLYLGFTLAEATVTDGYPVGPKEQFALDLAGGVTLYAVTDGPTVDIRIIEGGD